MRKLKLETKVIRKKPKKKAKQWATTTSTKQASN
jgi:hypothetical protein